MIAPVSISQVATWPAASIKFDDKTDYVEPVYNLSKVDPLALMIWWRLDESTWGSESYPPDANIMVQRLQIIATEGTDSVEKLLTGIVNNVPEKYREEAQLAREYYVDKFVKIGLKHEEPISRIRRAMFKVLTDTQEMKAQDLALLSRVYDFYLEDQFVEQLIETSVSVDTSTAYIPNIINQVYTVVGNNRRITKQAKLNVWWMQGEDKTLLMLTSPLHATTNSLVEQMLPAGARWHISCDTCAVRAVMGHRDFNTRVLTHGYKLSEAPDSA